MRHLLRHAPSTTPGLRLLFGCLLPVCLLGGCHRGAAAAPQVPPPTDVAVVTVAPLDVPMTFEYLGRTEGSREVEVRARVSGFLDSRHFVEGAMVEAGQLLFQIDPKPLQAQAAAAGAEVEVATARLEQAARERQRFDALVKDDAVSKKERDDAVSAEAIAKAQLETAKAHLQQIELDLQYTRVTAPIAGKIGQALLPEGSLVEPTDKGLLTTLLQLDPIYVAFHRTETQQFAFDADLHSGRLQLPTGGRLAVEVRFRDGTLLADGGEVDYTAGRLDTATGTIPMRATLPNKDHRLLAGQAIKVVLRGAVLKAALTVPQRAVVESTQGKSVLLAVDKDGGTVFESRPIDVGEWIDLPGSGPASHAWVVRSGLAAGDRVIVDNLVRLSQMPPGMPVHVVEPAAANAAPADGPGGANSGNGSGSSTGKGN